MFPKPTLYYNYIKISKNHWYSDIIPNIWVYRVCRCIWAPEIGPASKLYSWPYNTVEIY